MVKKQDEIDEMVPLVIFANGMSFGDLALLSNKGRAGTVVTLNDCYFAVISAESFDKLLRKDKALRQTQNVRFLRQVPYIRNWLIKETHSLFLLCKERKIDLRGQTILREGTPCDKVLIMHQGELEIIKTDLSSIFYNH